MNIKLAHTCQKRHFFFKNGGHFENQDGSHGSTSGHLIDYEGMITYNHNKEEMNSFSTKLKEKSPFKCAYPLFLGATYYVSLCSQYCL